MKIVIAVAVHKPYRVPEEAPYLPMEVGAALRQEHLVLSNGEPMRRDDEGEQISAKNASWCELTAMYRLWRDAAPEAECLGLCHYRRYFSNGSFPDGAARYDRIMPRRGYEALMAGCDVLLPKKRHYFIQSSRGQYIHSHHERDLTVTRAVLAEKDPRYAAAFDRVMRRTSGHRFNMLVMRREPFMAYCGWLFPVLTEVERRLDTTGYSASDLRVFGYLAERLLDVWLEADGTELRVKECPVVNLESQHWPRKILSFLRRMLKPART